MLGENVGALPKTNQSGLPGGCNGGGFPFRLNLYAANIHSALKLDTTAVVSQ